MTDFVSLTHYRPIHIHNYDHVHLWNWFCNFVLITLQIFLLKLLKFAYRKCSINRPGALHFSEKGAFIKTLNGREADQLTVRWLNPY